MAKTKAKTKRNQPGYTATAHPVPVFNDDVAPSTWAVKASWILRALILTGGILQLFFGIWSNGLLTLVCLALIVVPGFFTRGRIKGMPLEVELLLFIIVFIQCILGAGQNSFYTNIPYSDKIVHFMFPMFVGLIGFMIIYALYFAGQVDASPLALCAIIILVTIGVAGAWEVVEYSSDRWLYPDIMSHHFQGNAEQDALNDTMTDIIMGMLAGLGAAGLGYWLINRAKKQEKPRLYSMFEELQETFSGKEVKSHMGR